MKQPKFNILKSGNEDLSKTMKLSTPDRDLNSNNLAVNSYNIKLHEPIMKNVLYKEAEQQNANGEKKSMKDK